MKRKLMVIPVLLGIAVLFAVTLSTAEDKGGPVIRHLDVPSAWRLSG